MKTGLSASTGGRETPDESIRKALKSADQLSLWLTSAPKWLALAVVAWQIRLSIEALTGRNGLASLLERFGRQTSLWELACWASGLAGVVLGIYSRIVLHRQQARPAMRR